MISRAAQPQLPVYLTELAISDGADTTRAEDDGTAVDRWGEPNGELGIVIQKDSAWQDQTGAPDDPQSGVIPRGNRDVRVGADFNQGTSDGFNVDSGQFQVDNGRLEISPTNLGEDAVSVFYVDSYLPSYFELEATINAGKPTGGLKSNAVLVFDYHGPEDFKWAGINISNNKLEIGYRDATGWHEVGESNAKLRSNRDYRVLISLNGTTATVVVDNNSVFTHVFAPRVDADGFAYGLNAGMVGIGAQNSISRIDNVQVKVLAPESTLELQEEFDADAGTFSGASVGSWQVEGGSLSGSTRTGIATQAATFNLPAADARTAKGASICIKLFLQFQR